LVTYNILLDSKVGVGATCEGEELIGVFTHPGFDVVAGNIVPFDTIIVEVIEDGNAGFISAVLTELTVIWLGLVSTTGGRPVTAPSDSAVGGSDSARGTRPEPSVDNGGLEVGAITAIKVALAS